MEACIPTVREISPVQTTQIHQFQISAATLKEGEASLRRRRTLSRVDRELENGNYKAALSLVKQLKAHPGGLLRGFGAVAAPKISQEDFKKTKEEENYNSISADHIICMQHEAGHFLVGYMLGVLPRRYKVPSVEELLQDKFTRGKVEFLGFEFLRDVGLDPMSDKVFSRGRVNNETLKKFSCVALGGLTAEHLLFGYSELLHSDVSKLDRVLKWFGFTENEVESKTREAAEAAVLILSCQGEAQSRLGEAMALGRSVSYCIDTIERALNFSE